MRVNPTILTEQQIAAAMTEWAFRQDADDEIGSSTTLGDLGPPHQTTAERNDEFGRRIAAGLCSIAGDQYERRFQTPKPTSLPEHDPRYESKRRLRQYTIAGALGVICFIVVVATAKLCGAF